MIQFNLCIYNIHLCKENAGSIYLHVHTNMWTQIQVKNSE